MAASIDSTTAHLTPPHHRSRRAAAPSPSTLDSLRSTLSQASLHDTTHSSTRNNTSTTSLPGLLAQSQRQRARDRDPSSSSSPSLLSSSGREPTNRSQKSHQAPTFPVKMRSEGGAVEMSGSRPPHPSSAYSHNNTNHNHHSSNSSERRNKSSSTPRRTSSNFYSQQNNSSSNLLHQDSTKTDKDSSKPTLPALQISTDKSWSSGWAQGEVESMIQGSGDARDKKGEQKLGSNNIDDEDEDSYFGDILDKYCNSDDDPTSPSTASPTSPFSGRKDFWAAQPPTPPVTSSSRRRLDHHQQQQRDPFAVQSPSRRAAAPLRNAPTAAAAQPTDYLAASTLSSPTSSTTNSPMMAASAKFSSYLQSGPARGSRESFTLHHDASSSSLLSPPTATPGSTPRAYSKRPLPMPSSSTTTTTTSSASNSISTSESPRVSVASTSNRSSFLSLNHSTPDLRDIRPELPQKDSSRRMLGNAHNNNTTTTTNTTKTNSNNHPYTANSNNNSNSSSSTSHLPPMLGDTHLSDSLTSFSAVVEASMERRRNASVSSGGSSALADINPYADNATVSGTVTGASKMPSSNSSNNHNHHGSNSSGSTGGHSSSSSGARPSQLSYLTNGRPKDRSASAGSNHQHLYHHQGQNNSATSLSRNQQQSQSQSEEQSYYRQQRHQHQQQSSNSSSRPYDGSSLSQYSSSSPAMYSSSSSSGGGGITPSEMLSSRLNSSRMRSHSQGSISTTSSTTNNHTNYNNSSSTVDVNSYQYQHQLQQNPHQRHYGAVKPAIMKTPIARARAREAKGPRKVVFGDMITIVTIERPETPPPPVSSPGSDKDKEKKKKALAAAKKKAKKNGDKTGPHPDPEYDEEYFNQPYTPVPADVLVTQAPWIGNPNYDEEKQNSKFYYEDDAADYEYDDGYEYEAPFDIRSGPGDEDDEEDDEDEDDDDSVKGRAWGNGIAGGGADGAKKKGGGMFKFKKAVNRLLRN